MATRGWYGIKAHASQSGFGIINIFREQNITTGKISVASVFM